MSFQQQIEQRVARERAAPAYDNYLRVRDHVFRMMDGWETSEEGGPSAYWRREIEGFLYMFDASPLLIEQLREQTYHITGIRSYEYRAHHKHQADDFAFKFELLKALDTVGLFVPEAPILGGFGFEMPDGAGLANIDTLKFYEVLLGMEKVGLLPAFRGPQKARRTVVEIGTGWGGFAQAFKTVCPDSTYVLVDLPPTMIFSASYLTTAFPDAKFLFWGEEGFDEKVARLDDYDFVFLPHYAFPQFSPAKIDLGVNMVSFQEMTAGQVEAYVGRLHALGCPRLYSLNRDRSPHNAELSSVSEAIASRYKVKGVDMLEMPYTQLRPRKWPRPPSPHDYRHLYAPKPR